MKNLSYSHSSEFVEAFKKGEEKAFRHLYNTHYVSLRYFANRLIQDAYLADDFVSEGFIKLWKRKERFEHPKTISSFLYLVIRNACINHIRNKNRRKKMNLEMASPIPADEELQIRHFEQQLQQVALSEASKFPPKMREVFFYYTMKA